MKNRYSVGPIVTLLMTTDQADRWNAGSLTDADMESIHVIYPTTNRGLPDSEQILMIRCFDVADQKYDPEVVSELEANHHAELCDAR